jgi:uridylate kinase
VIKLTKVGGVYDQDPKHVPNAKIIHKMRYEDALTKNAFDKSSICIAMEHELPFGVVGFENMKNFLDGHNVGTLIS